MNHHRVKAFIAHFPVRLWPHTLDTLGMQLIAVTVLAVLLSNAVVVVWFGFGSQRNNDKAAN